MIKTANLVGSISRNAGGLHDSVRRLVQCIHQLDVGVEILSIQDEFSEEDLPLWNLLPVHVFPACFPRAFAYSPHFMPVLNGIRPDLIHTHGIWQYPSIATAAHSHKHRIPYMISAHGMLDPWAIRHHRWKKAIAFNLYEGNHVCGAKCFRALCESEARSIRQLGLRNPIAIIPNGIDLPDESTVRRAVANNPFTRYEIEPGRRRVLLYLGRIHPKKGLVNLISAWREIHHSQQTKSSANTWVLAIAGWDQGGHEAELKALAKELEIPWSDAKTASPLSPHDHEHTQEINNKKIANPREASLLFLGPQFGDDKAACYANCDAFVLPSFSEGLPMVILEAWAYGKPVVMTPECNLPEGFSANAALRIETNVSSITYGLRNLTESTKGDLQSIGTRGRDLVIERFTWHSIAQQLKTTYEWMLGSSDRPLWMFGR